MLVCFLQNLISAHKDWVCSMDFLRSHNVLLSGCRGGVLKLWEPDTCQEIGRFTITVCRAAIDICSPVKQLKKGLYPIDLFSYEFKASKRWTDTT